MKLLTLRGWTGCIIILVIFMLAWIGWMLFAQATDNGKPLVATTIDSRELIKIATDNGLELEAAILWLLNAAKALGKEQEFGWMAAAYVKALLERYKPMEGEKPDENNSDLDI